MVRLEILVVHACHKNDLGTRHLDDALLYIGRCISLDHIFVNIDLVEGLQLA